MSAPKSIIERMQNYTVSANGCWIWQGARNKDNYGVLEMPGCRAHGKRVVLGAHRISFVLRNGVLLGGLGVLHKCDNPPCINPDHLFAGTQSDNMADMARKGRRVYARGVYAPGSKLNDETVRNIRKWSSEGLGVRFIARHVGVTHNTIESILKGKTWRHVA